MEAARIISLISTIFLLVNCTLFFARRDKRNKPLSIFVYYLISISIIQSTTVILSRLKIDNIYLSHFYFIIQFYLLTEFYKSILLNKTVKNVTLFFQIVIGLVLVVQYIIEPNLIMKFNLLEIVICSIPLTILSFLYILQSIDKKDKFFIYINSGVFLYLLCSTLIFVMGNYVKDIETFWFKFFWIFNVFLFLLYQLLIFIEWFKNFRKKEVNA